MAEFTMPSLGADMDEGTLAQWLVHPGDRVARGDVVAVVETAKSAIEVECFESGTVDALLVDEGTTVPVGTPLAHIATSDGGPPGEHPHPRGAGERSLRSTPLVRRLAEDRHVDLATVHGSGPGGRITRADVERATPEKQTGTKRPTGTKSSTAASSDRTASRVRSSPLARRLAAELGVDLASVTGTGSGGTVRAADVRAAAGPPTVRTTEAPTTTRAARPGAPEAHPRPLPPHAARSATARLMSRAKREIPHFYLSTTVDMAAALEWMHTRNRELSLSARLVPAALTLKAVALAARKVPELNGHWVGDGFVPADGVRLGVAVSLRGGGLLAPAVDRADTLSVDDLMAALRDLAARARDGRLRASETADPSITVTNLGDQGVESVFGVIYPPQVALVGLGRITDRPVAVNGLLGVHPTLTVTLSADHRAADGATGARLLNAVHRLLQQPEEL
ncbi:2-oxo acid dehydrogenase subunit E2 [Streptomyces sp. Da 82-17]|uniref:2-oxo acid dehydrogenase subunit E2 n=1 Tax=Streptomyces sp. Da 82-17 TaxID=3377116 RepID=UPI0038D514ED